jgi:hypothetical protein
MPANVPLPKSGQNGRKCSGQRSRMAGAFATRTGRLPSGDGEPLRSADCVTERRLES